MSDAKFSWNVFYKGPDGFKEHLQATADDAESLFKGREGALKALKDIGAQPEDDRTRGRSTGSFSRPAQPVSDPMVEAAIAAGVTKVCPKHNVSMRFVQGGFSKTKTLPNGDPKPYSASWRCTERGCDQIEWLGGRN